MRTFVMACLALLSFMCSAEKGSLLRSRIRAPAVELTEEEKAFNLESFAGFRFGDPTPESSCWPKPYELYALSTPFRAFTRAYVRYSRFTRKLCEVELNGSVEDWDVASVSNEVAKLQGMVSARYGIRLLHKISVRDSGCRMSFENENVSIDIHGDSSAIVLKVLDKRIAEEDRKARVTSRRAVSIPDAEGFPELERIAKTVVKKPVPHGGSAGIVSGGFRNASGTQGLVSERLLADKATDTFTSGSTGIVVRLCTRGADSGMNGVLFWRDFTITSDGRISAIDAEGDAMGVYTDQ